MQAWDMQYEFDDKRYTFNDLIKFHRKYVDRDYPFEKWFNDHINYGTIKPMTSEHDSVRRKEERMGSEWRMSDNSCRGRRDNISVMQDKSSVGMADEGRAYFHELYNPANLRNREKYARDLAAYEEICQSYDPIRTEPLIKKRLASYFRGEYHHLGKEWILAEKAYQEALAAWAPKETADILPDEKIKFQLLHIYFTQENFRQAIPLLEELLAAIRSGWTDCGLSEDDVYDIYTTKCCIDERGLGCDDLEALKNMLAKIHRDILERGSYDLLKLSGKRLTFVFASIILLVGNHHVSRKECENYQEILDYVDANQDVLLTEDNQRAFFLSACKLLLQEVPS